MRFDPVQRTWLRNEANGVQEEADLLRAFEEEADSVQCDSVWLTGKVDQRVATPRGPRLEVPEYAPCAEQPQLADDTIAAKGPKLLMFKTLGRSTSPSPASTVRVRSSGSALRPPQRKRSVLALPLTRLPRPRPASTSLYECAFPFISLGLTSQLEQEFEQAEASNREQMRLLGLAL